MELNFGLIGCGRIAKRHAEIIKKTENANLIAVCDIDSAKATIFGNEFSANTFNTIDKLLLNSDIDIVSICTPNGLHAIHTIKALKAGKHVLCEKPMAINVVDCGEMIKAAEKANKRLCIIKQNR